MSDHQRDRDDIGPDSSSEEPTTEEGPTPQPAGSGPGEYVGRAQPIDPGRRPPQLEDVAEDDGDVESEPPPGGHRGPATAPAEADLGRLRARPGSPDPPARGGSRRLRQAAAMGAVERVRGEADFPVVLRGYDRAAVDAYVAEVAQLVAELEATQLPESVVRRALDDVGDETSEILKHAHEAAAETTARSRTQAEGRLRRADQEADLTRREAEEYARRLEEDSGAIWQERQRLLDEIRQLADDVLATADDAADRMSPPAGLEEMAGRRSPDGGAPGEPPPGRPFGAVGGADAVGELSDEPEGDEAEGRRVGAPRDDRLVADAAADDEDEQLDAEADADIDDGAEAVGADDVERIDPGDDTGPLEDEPTLAEDRFGTPPSEEQTFVTGPAAARDVADDDPPTEENRLDDDEPAGGGRGAH
jgi:DivIVA domain-containing protein